MYVGKEVCYVYHRHSFMNIYDSYISIMSVCMYIYTYLCMNVYCV